MIYCFLIHTRNTTTKLPLIRLPLINTVTLKSFLSQHLFPLLFLLREEPINGADEDAIIDTLLYDPMRHGWLLK